MSRHRSRVPSPLAAAIGTAAALLAGQAAASETPVPVNSPGFDVEAASPGAPTAAAAGAVPADPDTPPLVVRIGVAWPSLEASPGVYRWDALDAAVRAASEAGREIILNFYGLSPVYATEGPASGPSPDERTALEAWEACLRAVAGRYAAQVRLYQVGRSPDRGEGRPPAEAARDYAFVFKRSAVALRSADADALVATGTVAPGSLEFVQALYEQDLAPYADAISASYDGSEGARRDLATLSGLILAGDPSAKLWINGVSVLAGPGGYGGLLRAYAVALEREASLITFDDPLDAQGRPFHIGALERARSTFTPAYAPLVESGRGVRILDASGAPIPGGRASRFFDPDSKTVLMIYEGGGSARRGDFGVFVVDTADLAEPALYDLTTGESSASVAFQKDPNSGLTRLALPLAEYPIVLSYRRFTTPEYAKESEKLAVTGEHIPTAEEIIVRHQAAQAAQDALLRSVRAEAEEDWHFSIGTGGSFDITFKESFYLDPNVGAEWEQREVYINGVRWKLETIPEIPFVMPEKVVSLPLKITLSRDYTYAYEGREEVDGRDCYVIVFGPIDRDRNLASGRVWIDVETHARARLAMVQSNLPSPVISNDQRDTYSPAIGPDGFTYWVLSRIDAQSIYSTAGRNFVISKQVRLSDFVINEPGFEERRRAALASRHQMLRDTEKGLRYLQPSGEGDRVVKEGVSTSSLFVLGGVFYNESFDYPLPLAGINYFNSDLNGRGLQTNVFYAGVLAFANLSDPSLFGTRMDGSVDFSGIAVAPKDRLVRENPLTGNVSERRKEEVTSRTQSVTPGIGFPFWKFFKIKTEGTLAFTDYGRTGETADERCREFVIPADTSVTTGTLTAEFNRRALAVSLSHSWSNRASHEPWGLVYRDPVSTGRPACPAPNPPSAPDFYPGAHDYVQYGGAVGKEFYLPFNQKIRLQVQAIGGRDLDRFSKYSFEFFDTRFRGFSGSGVRFTNGLIAHAAYSFNLGDVIRFDTVLDHARVKDRQLGEDFRGYTGLGFAGQFIGPYGLIFRFDWGIALDSEVPEFEGEQEILFSVLKLFSQR